MNMYIKEGAIIIELDKVVSICESLQKTNSIKERTKILAENKDNMLFKRIIYFLLNNFVITGISTAKMAKPITIMPTKTLTSLEKVLEYVEINNTGRDIDIANCNSYIDILSEHNAEFVRKLITKKLRLGVDQKTVNKVYGESFIPVWDVQQGYPIEKYPIKSNTYFFLSQKLNGIRCTYLNGKLLSRQGQEFFGLNKIVDEIKSNKLDNYFIDGELIRKNYNNVSDNENFRLTTSIVAADDADKSELEFVIFDMFPAEQLKNGESMWVYKMRKEAMCNLSAQLSKYNTHYLRVVPFLYEGDDQSQIEKYLSIMDAEGKEGLMLNKNVVYKCKRHNGCLKVKTFKTADLRIIGYEEGSGRLEKTLGALIVSYDNNIVNVGSGFTDSQRTFFWENRENLVGKIAEVKYKEISLDSKTGKPSLQFPIFVTIRNDKTEESLN